MRIGELAEAVGVSTDTVRFYERSGWLPRASRRDNTYREYGPADVEHLRLIIDLRRLDLPLEDAARILGGSRLLALRRVVVPLLKRGLAGAFILVFIPATRELSSAIFLYTTGTQVLSVLLFDKSDEGNFEVLSSMGLILVVGTVALVLAGFRLVGRDFLLRRTAS